MMTNIRSRTTLLLAVLAMPALSTKADFECQLNVDLIELEDKANLHIDLSVADKLGCANPSNRSIYILDVQVPFNVQDDRMQYLRYITSEDLDDGIIFKTKFGGELEYAKADMDYMYRGKGGKLAKPTQLDGSARGNYRHSVHFGCKAHCVTHS